MIVICAVCHVEMESRISEMGITVVSPSRNAIYRGDRYTCPNCNAQVITDFGAQMTKRLDNFDNILSHADNNLDAIHLRR